MQPREPLPESLNALCDEDLIRLGRDRPELSRRCLDLVFERAYPRVARWCLRACENRDEASELAQLIMMRAYTRLDSFRVESRFSTWLYTLGRRVAIDRGRALRRASARAAPKQALDNLEDPLQSSAMLEECLMSAAVRETMIASLDPLEARVVYLHHVDGLSLPAITALLDLHNKSGAKAYLVNGMRKLRRRFRRNDATAMQVA
jgi:RNA polymerase sigma-70 factor (ECF subfamily)